MAKPAETQEQTISTIDATNDSAWSVRRENPKRTVLLAEQALALAQEIDYSKGQAYAYLALSYGQMVLSELEEAKATNLQSQTFFTAIDDVPGLVKALNTLGIIQGKSGELIESLETFLKVNQYCKDLKDNLGQADALNNIGIIFTHTGDFSTSLDYHLQSLGLSQQHGLRLAELRSLTNVGEVNNQLGYFQDALDYFQKALAFPEASSDPESHMVVLLNQGLCYQELEEYQAAKASFEEALTLAEEVGDKLMMGGAQRCLALIDVIEQQWPEAHQRFQESLDIYQDGGHKRGLIETHLDLHNLYSQEANHHRALEHSQLALELASEVGDKAAIYRAERNVSEAYEQLDELAEALSHLKRHLTIRDEVFNAQSDQKMQALRVQSNVMQAEQERELYRLRNIELVKANDSLQVLNFALAEASEAKTRLLEELEHQATHDALTGLYNRRYFNQHASQAFARQQRFGGDISFVIADVDDFKKVNDRFSHQVGDEVLQIVARLCASTIRRADTVARYGGEEFVFLLVETSVKGALVLCEKVRQAIQDYSWHEIHPKLKVTMSFGVSGDATLESYEKMLTQADQKLYEVKRSGKNRVGH